MLGKLETKVINFSIKLVVFATLKNARYKTLVSLKMTCLTRPETAAVVVAMAGTILPAIFFVLKRSAVSMLYMVARKF